MTTTLMSMHDNSTNKHDGWCMDSGATTDFCCRIDMMTNIRAGNKVAVRYGDGSKHTIAGTRGTVTMHGANGKPFTRNNVLFMPQLKHNFLSISKLDDEGFRFVIENKTAKVFKDKTVVLSGKRDLFGSKLHWTTPHQSENIHSLLNKEPRKTPSCETVHARFAHLSMRSIYRSANAIDGIKPREKWLKHGRDHDCETCKLTKMRRRTFKRSRDMNSLPSRPLERVCSDLKTSLRRSVRGFRHWIIIVDGYSRYIWGKTLRYKSDAYEAIKEYIAWAKANKKNLSIVKFMSDFGGEFEDHRVQTLLRAEGATWSPAAPRSQSSNGVAEIQMKFITLAIISMCKHANKSTSFWCYAFDLVLRIRNAILNSGSMQPNMSPHEAFFGRKFSEIQR